MSGVIAVLITISLRVGRRISETIKKWSDVPDWIFILIGIGCIFWAGFAAWQDKNLDLIALKEKLKAPEFDGKINVTLIGKMNGHPLVVVGGLIWNSVGSQSGAIDWKMTIEFPDGKKIKGETPFITGKDQTVSLEDYDFIFPTERYWPEISTHPIVGGAVLQGWFWSSFPGLDINEAVSKKASVAIEFTDVVAQKKHVLMTKLENLGVHPPAANMPHQNIPGETKAGK
jgi:hypothetical protein